MSDSSGWKVVKGAKYQKRPSASYFYNEVSRREYAISGWCQHCQNEMFDDTATEGM